MVDVPAENFEDVILYVGQAMQSAGLVRDTYPHAVLEREKKHPTGLPDHVMAAIPHVSGEHVLKPGIAVACLRNPVTFYNIANPEEALSIRIVFMLAIKDPGEQLNTLRALTKTFQNVELMDRMRNAESKDALIAALEAAGWQNGD